MHVRHTVFVVVCRQQRRTRAAQFIFVLVARPFLCIFVKGKQRASAVSLRSVSAAY